jgi:hypothetical protein
MDLLPTAQRYSVSTLLTERGKMSKDKTPNRTLAIALDKRCDLTDCHNHGTVSITRSNGTVRTRCTEHLATKTKQESDAYLLKFLNLA